MSSVAITRLDASTADFQKRLADLLSFSADTDAAIHQAVAEILDAVRRRGDAAVVEYTRRFDR
ncbi:MAG: histidinol dehydrogenase, partial [Pseudomonadota bacterium]